MKLKNLKDKSGFTIIEVLIVLAVAGMIMLVVFLAVPALQRNSRNTARNSEASRVAGLVTECLSNRNGTITSCDTAAEVGYNVAEFQQFTSLALSNTAAVPANSTTAIGVHFGRVCTGDASASTTAGATARSFAVLFRLEPAVQRCVAG